MKHAKENFFSRFISCMRIVPILLLVIIFATALTGCSKLKKDTKNETQETEVKATEAETKAASNNEVTVFINATYGGDEFGAVNGDLYAKNLNILIARKVRSELAKNGYNVIMSRVGDETVPLDSRIKELDKSGARFAISIAQNSFDNKDVSGVETIYNASSNADNHAFADAIQKYVSESTNAKDRGVKDNTSFAFLKNTKVTTCMLNTGFISSTKEVKQLCDDAYQEKIAQGILKAIETYLKDNDEGTPAKLSDEEWKKLSEKYTAEEKKADKVSAVSAQFSDSSKDDKNKDKDNDEKIVYITIDDGPTTRTPKFLEVLDKYDAKATWFVTSQYLEGNALTDMIKKIHAKGHTVAVHTYSHKYSEIYASPDAYIKDYNKMQSIINSAIKTDSRIFRFPGGSNAGYNKSIRSELLKRVTAEGLVYFDWNAFTGDVEGLGKEQMIKKAVKECCYRDQSILLMHDIPNKPEVVEALPSILKQLKAKGYKFRALNKDVTPIQFVKADN